MHVQHLAVHGQHEPALAAVDWWWGQDTSAVTCVLEKQFPQLHIPFPVLCWI